MVLLNPGVFLKGLGVSLSLIEEVNSTILGVALPVEGVVSVALGVAVTVTRFISGGRGVSLPLVAEINLMILGVACPVDGVVTVALGVAVLDP